MDITNRPPTLTAVEQVLVGLLLALPLQVVCAWCATEMRPGVLPVSHGICAPCRARFEGEL